MIEFRITGDEAVYRMLRGELGAFESRVKKFMAKWALGTVATVKEKYLTDPGRPRFRWRVSRRTGRKYVSVPRGFYPRPRIGVITGRLRSSFGTPQEAQQARDAVRETGRDRHRFWVRVGTNVEYAPFVARRKYDFRTLGAEAFYESTKMEQLVEELRRSLFAGH